MANQAFAEKAAVVDECRAAYSQLLIDKALVDREKLSAQSAAQLLEDELTRAQSKIRKLEAQVEDLNMQTEAS